MEDQTQKTPKVKETNPAKAEVFIVTQDGISKKKASLPTALFDGKQSEITLAQYIRVYHWNQRQGTVSTKTRSEVVGSTRKIYRQKGTGGARHGARKAPIFVGGGITFGPKPRDLSRSMNKKQKRTALITALTTQYKNNAVYIMQDDLASIEPKTKHCVQIFSKAAFKKDQILVIHSGSGAENFLKASKNIPGIEQIPAKEINPYVIMRYPVILIFESAIPVLETHFTTS